MESPQTVIFTQRAFNAIVTETISKHPIETGGIFLGYVMDNGTWIVVENVAPGAKSTHRSAYFEYDTAFVTYLANVLANQYKGNLQILGLWHRHPGSMDVFSSTDDQTNRNYAIDHPHGAISALVNCDPKWRMTMYHVSQSGEYQEAEWFVDDNDLIPDDLVALRYTNPENVPVFDRRGVVNTDNVHEDVHDGGSEVVGYTVSVDGESMSSPQGTLRPYTFRMALRDMRTVINNLIKGTTDANNQ